MNLEIDTTKFVNIDDKPFDIYINGKLVRHLEAKEEQTLVLYVAQIGAKHLVDRVLQEKHSIKDSLRDTPLRKELFRQILPEMAEELKVKPLTAEEFQKELKTQMDKQQEVIASFKEKDDKRDKEIEDLRAEVDKLKKKPGRPAKVESAE